MEALVGLPQLSFASKIVLAEKRKHNGATEGLHVKDVKTRERGESERGESESVAAFPWQFLAK